eukprot:CAMPEP_0185757724 /NCGR_PEP_ID=MMETSP1174-20130828/16208_1 /TAXON_ID=35687 /ORGANISM="Dictyocha speculum, Strain CCMP1381" /LENGTH=44 /DNA_ID= /DNA_START= /DNA_END= /DNA_ORIENTATION=
MNKKSKAKENQYGNTNDLVVMNDLCFETSLAKNYLIPDSKDKSG